MLSHSLCAEAEQEMRLARLPSLEIEWTFARPRSEAQDTPDNERRYDLLASTASHFSSDLSLVYLNLEIGPEDSEQLEHLRRWGADTYDRHCLLECLGYSDVGFPERLVVRNDTFPDHCLGQYRDVAVMLAPGRLNYMEVPWKDIDFVERKISVDWRHLLDRPFREEAYIDREKRALHSDSAVGSSTYAETAIKDLQTRLDNGTLEITTTVGKMIVRVDEETWVEEHGKEDNEAYFEAYILRLRTSYAEAGKTFDLGACDEYVRKREGRAFDHKKVLKARDYIMEWQIVRARENRNAWIIEDFAKKHGIQREVED
jgi:hypothetical protein